MERKPKYKRTDYRNNNKPTIFSRNKCYKFDEQRDEWEEHCAKIHSSEVTLLKFITWNVLFDFFNFEKELHTSQRIPRILQILEVKKRLLYILTFEIRKKMQIS